MGKETLRTGAKAPPFSLPDQDGKTVSLADLSGQWAVLYFYPKDDTPGCTREACEFTSLLGQFQSLGARVIGISPDKPEVHRRFIAKHHLKLELLSDPEHAVLARYGAWGEKSMYGKKYEGVIRSTVLIGPDGLIAHHWPNVKAAGHAAAVATKLAELKAGRN